MIMFLEKPLLHLIVGVGRLRGIVDEAFRRRAILHMEPHILAIAEQLATELFAEGSPADLVDRYARKLTLSVICELLGLPLADRPKFTAWAGWRHARRWRHRLPQQDPEYLRNEALSGETARSSARYAASAGEPRSAAIGAIPVTSAPGTDLPMARFRRYRKQRT
jgi:cytochrome P450